MNLRSSFSDVGGKYEKKNNDSRDMRSGACDIVLSVYTDTGICMRNMIEQGAAYSRSPACYDQYVLTYDSLDFMVLRDATSMRRMLPQIFCSERYLDSLI